MCQTNLWSGQGISHDQVSVSFDKREALCILMQYEATGIHIWNNGTKIHLYDIFCYQMIMMLKCGTG